MGSVLSVVSEMEINSIRSALGMLGINKRT